ncbi:MAG TPA: hypothetical protein DIU45_18365, partial [Clostridium sp.]|nr:hypothetical protein [Clostridium sp.]
LESIANKSRTVLNFYMLLEIKDKNSDTARQVLEDAYISVKNELESQEMYVEQLKEKEIKQLLYEK